MEQPNNNVDQATGETLAAKLSTDCTAVLDMMRELSFYVKYHNNFDIPNNLEVDSAKILVAIEGFQELKQLYMAHPFNVEKACKQFGLDSGFVTGSMRQLLVQQGDESDDISDNVHSLVGRVVKAFIRERMGIYTTEKKGLKINRDYLVSWLLSNLKTLVPKESQDTLLVYNYMTGVWDDCTSRLIVQRLLIYYLFTYCGGGDLWTMQLETSVMSLIIKISSRIPLEKLNSRYRAFSNGDLDSSTFQFVPHDPKHYATRYSEVAIDESAQMPKMMEFLHQIIPDDETLECVRRYMGYCLTDSTAMHGFMVFLGRGANGKSVLISQLINILNSCNVSAVPITKLSDEFALEPLVGKFLNVSAENNATAFKTDRLKALVSGDRQTVNRKNKTMIDTVLTTKQLFAMNAEPIITESDRGLERRMHVVKFGVTIPAREQDTGLSEKLFKESSGFLNWLVEGLRLLAADGYKLHDSDEMEAIKQEIFLNNLPVDAFTAKIVKPGNIEKGTIRSSDLYNSFKEWCLQTGRSLGRVTNAKIFKSEFTDAFSRQYNQPVIYKKNSVMCVYGIEWRQGGQD